MWILSLSKPYIIFLLAFYFLGSAKSNMYVYNSLNFWIAPAEVNVMFLNKRPGLDQISRWATLKARMRERWNGGKSERIMEYYTKS